MKYKLIKNKTEYGSYCKKLEELMETGLKSRTIKEEIGLLTLLIEKWDKEHNTFSEMNPVEILCSLMEENYLKPKDLVKILGVSKGLISDILNYKKGFSKKIIRKLSGYFKVEQEAINRPYKLQNHVPAKKRNTRENITSYFPKNVPVNYVGLHT